MAYGLKASSCDPLTSYLIPNNKVNWIVTMKAKNRNKWTKNTMKTEGYIANQLSTAMVHFTAS